MPILVPVTPAASPEAGMTLATARGWIRQFARNAGSSAMYPDDQVDRALQSIGNRFCRVTRCVQQADLFDLLTGDDTVPLTDLAPTFRPERLMRAWLNGFSGALTMIDYIELNDLANDFARSGRPDRIAFGDRRTARVYPKPDVDYTCNMLWWRPFTTWTPGISAPAAALVTLNIPEEMLTAILPFGPTYVLQHNEPEHKYSGPTWEKYLEAEARYKGSGSLAAKVVSRVGARP